MTGVHMKGVAVEDKMANLVGDGESLPHGMMGCIDADYGRTGAPSQYPRSVIVEIGITYAGAESFGDYPNWHRRPFDPQASQKISDAIFDLAWFEHAPPPYPRRFLEQLWRATPAPLGY
jgi:hypothetical protein